jgi:hypothetical protein
MEQGGGLARLLLLASVFGPPATRSLLPRQAAPPRGAFLWAQTSELFRMALRPMLLRQYPDDRPRRANYRALPASRTRMGDATRVSARQVDGGGMARPLLGLASVASNRFGLGLRVWRTNQPVSDRARVSLNGRGLKPGDDRVLQGCVSSRSLGNRRHAHAIAGPSFRRHPGLG